MSSRQPLPFLAASGRAVTPIAFVNATLRAYRDRGLEPWEALRKAHIPPSELTRRNARVTAAQFEIFAETAMRELDDEALGWFSRRLPWGAYGMLCRASLTRGPLELALRRWRRHHRILTEDVLFALEVGNGLASWSIEERRDLGACREFCLVTLMRYVLGFTCWSIDSKIALARAEFPFPQPAHVSVYPTIFCKNLVFDAPCAKIVFDARYLALPLKRDEADLDHMLQRALPLTVLPYRRDRLLVERVRKLLRDAKTPFATAEDIADALALSTRTLHRQLAREGASLRELKEEARVEIAQRALARGGASVKRVAHAAGFRNEKSFSRAFRAWTGVTPSAFRAQAMRIPDAMA
ncbi:MAG TPA: AraC family transcriptional regulator [Rhodoblastus sp.]|nr:AraC family transcriptional regulator [Rhodoblastus sp.]